MMDILNTDFPIVVDFVIVPSIAVFVLFVLVITNKKLESKFEISKANFWRVNIAVIIAIFLQTIIVISWTTLFEINWTVLDILGFVVFGIFYTIYIAGLVRNFYVKMIKP